MKKVLIFIAGIVTGAILMLVIAALIGNSSNGESSNNGMTFFEKEGDCISENNFEVFQVLDSGDALANEIDELSISTGLMVLFLCDERKSYYEEDYCTCTCRSFAALVYLLHKAKRYSHILRRP